MPLPPAQKHLRELILNQLAVLKSPTRRCMWHPAVLEFASAIYTASPSAYAEAIAGGLIALPSMDHAKKCSRQVSSKLVGWSLTCAHVILTSFTARQGSTAPTGKNPVLIEALGAELDKLKVPTKLRDICLIWDEVNLTGQVH